MNILVVCECFASSANHYFLDMLVTVPVDRDESKMPSPNQLKRKIIIKVCEEFGFISGLFTISIKKVKLFVQGSDYCQIGLIRRLTIYMPYFVVYHILYTVSGRAKLHPSN